MLHSGPVGNTSSGVLQIAVSAVYMICGLAIAYTTYRYFDFGLIAALMSGVLLALIPSGILGRFIAKKDTAAEQQYEANIRADREAEKQKQIDTMQRKASSIPKVKR